MGLARFPRLGSALPRANKMEIAVFARYLNCNTLQNKNKRGGYKMPLRSILGPHTEKRKRRLGDVSFRPCSNKCGSPL